MQTEYILQTMAVNLFLFQLLVEMELLTGCTDGIFYQNWSEFKVQLGENIERMLTGEEKAPAEILGTGNFFIIIL